MKSFQLALVLVHQLLTLYNETNMTTASGTGHRDWEMRASSTHFGFAQVGDVIVGVSN